MRTAEVVRQTSSGEQVFTVRDLSTDEVREVLAKGEGDLLWRVVKKMVPTFDIELRHQLEIVIRGTVAPMIDYVDAIFLCRDDCETLTCLSKEILTLTCQRVGFETISAIHQVH